jgi:SAM-dependent methyltransferase
MLKEQMDKIYKSMDLDKIPWNSVEVPKILNEFVEKNIDLSSSIIELGCGAGNYVIHFSKMGYKATGVDFSERAISIARETAHSNNLKCSFWVADVVNDLSMINNTFDFIYDWELLHHIFPEQRNKYLKNVHRMLKPGGYYLSVSFSVENDQFGGKGKYRKTPLDTELYFSSEDEMHSLFSFYFGIDLLTTKEIAGKYAPHKVIFAVLNKSKIY